MFGLHKSSLKNSRYILARKEKLLLCDQYFNHLIWKNLNNKKYRLRCVFLKRWLRFYPFWQNRVALLHINKVNFTEKYWFYAPHTKKIYKEDKSPSPQKKSRITPIIRVWYWTKNKKLGRLQLSFLPSNFSLVSVANYPHEAS